MVDESPKAQSWWQTLPGIMTGVAAIITAVTGLVVAFNHSRTNEGTAGRSPSTETREAASVVPAGSRSSSAAPVVPPPQAIPIDLPSVNRVRLGGGDAVVTILSGAVEPIDLDRRSVTFHVRYMNAGRYPANFWSASYRLIVDDVPRAPTNNLNEVVDGDSAKEGDVVFEVPASVKEVVLQISADDEKSRLPFTLP
jgi:hypothetical protein